jgi:3-mercaptopropionate dioxygenase
MDGYLASFVHRMDAAVAASGDPRRNARHAQAYLAELVRHPEFLEERYRQPAEDRYRQHVVHVHPDGKYSVVSLVWKPGQVTPVHDHCCWCVVGVLQGEEIETRYRLRERAGERFLVRWEQHTYEPGSVCALVPPVEDIHQVANAGTDGVTISVHVYGADIAALGSSINQVFELPVVPRESAVTARAVSWRRHHRLAGSDSA